MDQNGLNKSEDTGIIANQPSLSETSKLPTIKQASILFSITLILFIVLSGFIPMIKVDYYIKALAGEIVMIMIPPLLFLAILKLDFKKTLRLNKISILNLLIIFGIMVFSIPAVGTLNLANMYVIKFIFGKTDLPAIQIPDAVTLLKGLVVIGMSAALCEEILFRGVIQKSFEKMGAMKSIILTSVLFGLMHHDFQKFLGTTLLGIIIGIIVYRTNSIFGGMFAHFTNNSLAVFVSFIGSQLTKLTHKTNLGQSSEILNSNDSLNMLSTLPKEQLIIIIIFWSVLFIGCISALIALFYAFIKNTKKTVPTMAIEPTQDKKRGLIWLAPGVTIMGLIYIIQGISLKGIHIDGLDNILRFLGF